MIDGKVQLLDFKCLIRRHHDGAVAGSRHLPPVFAGKANGFNAGRLCHGNGIHHILSIARGGNTHKYISLFSIAVQLLRINHFTVYII